MKIHILKILMFFSIFILGYSCQTIGTIDDFYSFSDPYHGGNYINIHDHWTRKIRIYIGGFDLELIAAATFKSLPFREAYTDEYARAYKLSEAEKEKMRIDQRNAAELYNEFIVSAFTPDRRWNDFQEKDAIWKVYLTKDDETLVKPIEVRQIKNVDAVMTHFFPYISLWDVVYLLRFPTSIPGTSEPLYSGDKTPMKLIITSVRGTAEMVW